MQSALDLHRGLGTPAALFRRRTLVPSHLLFFLRTRQPRLGLLADPAQTSPFFFANELKPHLISDSFPSKFEARKKLHIYFFF
jgi:hypothetical protein